MDYVVDAKPLLKKMERNGIGLKRASFIWFMHYIMTSTRGSMPQRRCTIWGCRSKQSVCSSGVHQ